MSNLENYMKQQAIFCEQNDSISTDHFYTCSDKILCGLGRMYAGGGELTENIDDVGGVGTAEFASKAINIFYMSGR